MKARVRTRQGVEGVEVLKRGALNIRLASSSDAGSGSGVTASAPADATSQSASRAVSHHGKMTLLHLTHRDVETWT
jgi:hypothetical protein